MACFSQSSTHVLSSGGPVLWGDEFLAGWLERPKQPINLFYDTHLAIIVCSLHGQPGLLPTANHSRSSLFSHRRRHMNLCSRLQRAASVGPHRASTSTMIFPSAHPTFTNTMLSLSIPPCLRCRQDGIRPAAVGTITRAICCRVVLEQVHPYVSRKLLLTQTQNTWQRRI